MSNDIAWRVRIGSRKYDALTTCVEVDGIFKYVNNVDGCETTHWKVKDAKNGEPGWMIFYMEKVA